MTYALTTDVEEILSSAEESLAALAGSHIFIAGAGGFLGRYFLKTFQTFNENSTIPIRVTGVDNFVSSSKAHNDTPYKAPIKFLKMDICEGFDPNEVEPPQYVINAGGIASPYYYRAKPLETIDVSVTGSKNLLEWARQHQARYTFFSSSEIYGDPDPKIVPIKEDYRGNVSTLGPRACYDESKRLGETLCYVYDTYFNLHTNIIRPFNIYGPGMMQYDYRVMPNFASCIKKGVNLKVYGDGRQTRTFCYITDAITGFLKVIANGRKGSPYNIGNPKPEITMDALADLFITIGNKKILKDISAYPDSYPSDEPMRRCPDISKAINDLNYNPKIDLDEGVAKFLGWSNEHYTAD